MKADEKCNLQKFQIFATVSSFYLPLLVILILYWRIYQTARKRIRRRPGLPPNAQGIAIGFIYFLPNWRTIFVSANAVTFWIRHERSFDCHRQWCKTLVGFSYSSGTTNTMGPPRPIGSSHAVGGALVQAQVSGGIAAAVVAVIGRPLPTISGEWREEDIARVLGTRALAVEDEFPVTGKSDRDIQDSLNVLVLGRCAYHLSPWNSYLSSDQPESHHSRYLSYLISVKSKDPKKYSDPDRSTCFSRAGKRNKY